jgi:hypothetical protein
LCLGATGHGKRGRSSDGGNDNAKPIHFASFQHLLVPFNEKDVCFLGIERRCQFLAKAAHGRFDYIFDWGATGD